MTMARLKTRIAWALEVHVLEIEGVRGRRLPAESCGGSIAVVRVRVGCSGW